MVLTGLALLALVFGAWLSNVRDTSSYPERVKTATVLLAGSCYLLAILITINVVEWIAEHL